MNLLSDIVIYITRTWSCLRQLISRGFTNIHEATRTPIERRRRGKLSCDVTDSRKAHTRSRFDPHTYALILGQCVLLLRKVYTKTVKLSQRGIL